MATNSLKNFLKISGSKGQGAVEYILLVVVMVTIITSIMAKIKRSYLGDALACASAAQQKTILCKINSFMSPTGGTKRFQYYPFKK